MQFDFGAVSILDANDGDAVIAVLESPIDGNIGSWDQFSKALPPEVLGNVIKIEWRFSADEFGNFAGWYLDDVNVTVP